MEIETMRTKKDGKKLLLLHPDPRASAMSFQICGRIKNKNKKRPD